MCDVCVPLLPPWESVGSGGRSHKYNSLPHPQIQLWRWNKYKLQGQCGKIHEDALNSKQSVERRRGGRLGYRLWLMGSTVSRSTYIHHRQCKTLGSQKWSEILFQTKEWKEAKSRWLNAPRVYPEWQSSAKLWRRGWRGNWKQQNRSGERSKVLTSMIRSVQKKVDKN